jgi:phenylacetate-CoA ligase
MRTLGRTPRLSIKGILPISEPVFPHQRELFQAVLGDVPLACFYGLSEKVLFAAEMPGRVGSYEFNPLYGMAELLDEAGEPVTEPGKEGRLVGTGFLSTGMPFIRYDTGDSARLLELPSVENGQRLRVDAVMPRRNVDYVVASDGSRVVAVDLTPEDPAFFEGIKEFQFYQDKPGEVLIRYVLSAGEDHTVAERFRAAMNARTRGSIRFLLEPVERIVAGRGGKRAFIVQRLDLSRL